MKALADLEVAMREIDARLRPIAERPVDINNPNWVNLLKEMNPLDEADVRPAAESLLNALLEEYQHRSEDGRKIIRDLFEKYTAFAWASTFPEAPTTGEAFRKHLVLFSMTDQGSDARDASGTLEDLCKRAVAAGVDAGPILREVAHLSSDKNKFGLGSTRKLLLSKRLHSQIS